MNNLIPLRKNQPFLVRDRVCIGNSKEVFEVVGLGLVQPVTAEFVGCKGKLVNGSEFVQLRVTGTEHSVFNIHCSFITRQEEVTHV